MDAAPPLAQTSTPAFYLGASCSNACVRASLFAQSLRLHQTSCSHGSQFTAGCCTLLLPAIFEIPVAHMTHMCGSVTPSHTDRYVARLILLHGRAAYKRNCEVVLYSFYKNWLHNLTYVFFAFVTGRWWVVLGALIMQLLLRMAVQRLMIDGHQCEADNCAIQEPAYCAWSCLLASCLLGTCHRCG